MQNSTIQRTKQRNAQVSVLYFSFLALFSLVFLFAIYTLSNHILEDSTTEFNQYHVNAIAASMKTKILEIRAIVEASNTTTSTLTRKLKLPSRLGPNEYIIYGNSNDLVFQTFGSDSEVITVPVYWWNISVDGQVQSSAGECELTYLPANNTIRIS